MRRGPTAPEGAAPAGVFTQLHLERSNMVPGAQSCVISRLLTICENLWGFGRALYGQFPFPLPPDICESRPPMSERHFRCMDPDNSPSGQFPSHHFSHPDNSLPVFFSTPNNCLHVISHFLHLKVSLSEPKTGYLSCEVGGNCNR